jgi:predicted nucleotidyltransferase
MLPDPTLANLPCKITLYLARGATEVWLVFEEERLRVFGSLVTGALNEHSDLDLAVEGLATGRYFEVLADLISLFSAPVDLVRLEEAPESLHQRIAAEGETL